jgi:hypothetical protein
MVVLSTSWPISFAGYAAYFHSDVPDAASVGGCNEAAELVPSTIVTLAIVGTSIPNMMNTVTIRPQASMMRSSCVLKLVIRYQMSQ